jgi:type I restriction enzyme M protein
MATSPALPQTIPDGKICDFIDNKLRDDTPEEYVRQNIERRLVLELDYDPSQIEVEFPIMIGSKRVRVDLAVFDEGAPHTQDRVKIIVECKRDSVQPSAARDGVGQLKSYMAACQNAEWGMWTNGKAKAVYRVVRGPAGAEYEEPNDIPRRGGTADEVDRPTRDDLVSATDDNLLFSFRICHNHIYVTDGLPKDAAFFELLKVIFCKIWDERNFGNQPLQFYATAKEKQSNDGRLTVVNRLSKVFEHVKRRHPAIFDANDAIKLNPRSLAYIVGELQRYSLLETHIDVKGKAYEELVGANLRGDRGEFFTPRNVQRMCVRMLDPQVSREELFLDPSCGTGGFLVIAMNVLIDQLTAEAESQVRKSEALKTALAEKIHEVASRRFFGFDINLNLVKATKMNMVMNNDGSGNIFRQDSLLHPHQWEGSFRKSLASALGIDPKDIRGPADLARFDIIATNPPFGSKLPIKDRETLGQYELGHIWKKNKTGRWEQTDELCSSQPPEILFIERCWQFLKPKGRMAIVLPDAILGAPSLGYVREWLLKSCRVVASVDLHPDTFQPNNGTRTSVLVVQKKTDEEIAKEAAHGLRDYDIFMAEVRAIGHDARGNAVYKRDENGKDLLFPPATGIQRKVERTATGLVTGRSLPPEKRRDDDTVQVADEFLKWKRKAVLGW